MIRRQLGWHFGRGPSVFARIIAISLAIAAVIAASLVQGQPAPPQPPSAPSAAPTPTTTPAPAPAPAETPAPPAVQSQTQSPAPPVVSGQAAAAAGLDAIKAALEAIESKLSSDGQTDDELADLARRVDTTRSDLASRQNVLQARLKQLEQRLGQLGAAPTGGATEGPVAAAERQNLTAIRTDVAAAVAQANLLADHAGDLEQRIDTRRRELFFTRRLARGASLLDYDFWSELNTAIPAEISALGGLVSLWTSYARVNGGPGGLAAAVAVLVGIGVVAWLAARWRRRLITDAAPRRFDKALIALLILGADTVTLPLLILASVMVLRNFGLLPSPIVEIGFGLGIAVAMAALARGVAIGLFAPGRPARRLFAMSEQAAESYASHLIWTARAFTFAIFLNVLHRATEAPASIHIATLDLLAVAVLVITVHLLWRSAQADFRPDRGEAAEHRLAWFRAIIWLIVAAIAAALATGYVGLAVFVAGRIVTAIVVGGAVIILVAFIDSLFAEVLASDSPYGRTLAAAFGLTPRGLDLAGTLISALLRLVLIVLAATVVLGFSGLFAEDLFGIFERATWNYVIGGFSFSLGAFLTAIAFLAIGTLAIRGAQRWLQTKFLPRTGLDAGLQNSILALFGYAAFIGVLALSLGALGIDLQKIAIIAGALSVGIGFGLQSIVANFVSGLILLAERPIRVGDWVVVQNEEGYVRRISVRATEIETFDRASVIIPNQQFITGTVKNWTHGSTIGRITIKVRVAFDSDVEQVRQILLGTADEHPRVLKTPPPLGLLMAFGDIGLDFELRCILANVAEGLTARNDLQTEILRRFRANGIKIPYPPHDERVPGPEIPSASQSGHP